MTKVIEIVQYISISLFFLFAIFLLTRKESKLSSRLLAGFLLVKMLCIIDLLLSASFYGAYIFKNMPHFMYILWPYYFLYLPLLFLYTRSIVYNDKPLHISDLKYLAVFIFAAIYMAWRFYFLPATVKQELVTQTGFWNEIWKMFLILYYPQSFFFLIASLLMLNSYKERLKQFYSTLEKINLSWLNLILWSFLVIYIISFIDDIVRLVGNYSSLYTALLLNSGFLVFAAMLIFKGLTYQSHLIGVEGDVKTKPVGLDDTLLTTYTNRLQHYMLHEKPYLYSSITLQELADKLSIPPRNLSYLLNNYIKQNFFDYINTYRIEEAKQILQKQNWPKTVLEVLYSVGFNSKSVFNTAFKKNTGMTPTEFIKYLERA